MAKTFSISNDRVSGLDGRRAGALLGSLIAVVVAVHLWWIWRDQSPAPVGDSYVYMTNLLRFLDGLRDGAFVDFSAAIRELSFGGRPPVYQLLTAPFVLLFGRTESAALMVNALFIAALAVLTYRIGVILVNPAAGLLAALLTTTYPPVVNLSRLYLPYCALPAATALSLWLLLRLVRDRSAPLAWAYGASLGLGLLIHPNFLWFAIPATLVMSVFTVFFQRRDDPREDSKGLGGRLVTRVTDRFVLLGLVPGAVVALLLSVPWYLVYGRYLLGLLKTVSTSRAAAIRGETVRAFGFPDADPGIWWYLVTAPGALSWVLAGLGLVGLVAASIGGGKLGRILVAAVVGTCAVLVSGTIFVWWYPPMVLPAVAALTAWWIVALPRRRLSTALVVLCLAAASFNFAVVTWGAGPGVSRVARLAGAPIDTPTCATRFNVAFCPAPPETSTVVWPVAEIVRVIGEDSECDERTCAIMVAHVGALSSVRFDYLAVREQPGLSLEVKGEAARVWGKPYNFKALLLSEYLLYPHGWSPPRLGTYKTATIRFLQSPSPLFERAHRHVATVDLPNGETARLIKRVADLTSGEAVQAIEALGLDDRFTSQRYDLLSRLYLKERDLGGMEDLHSGAAERGEDPSTIAMLSRRLERLRKINARRGPPQDMAGAGEGAGEPVSSQRAEGSNRGDAR
jgi:4-amino-4-deoxy-L-arabinose transferase-like glycosyltransferase